MCVVTVRFTLAETNFNYETFLINLICSLYEFGNCFTATVCNTITYRFVNLTYLNTTFLQFAGRNTSIFMEVFLKIFFIIWNMKKINILKIQTDFNFV